MNDRRRLWHSLLLAYGLMMVYLMLIRGRGGQVSPDYWESVRENCNLVPFRTISDFWDILIRREYYLEKFSDYGVYLHQVRHAVVNLAGNVVMFLPLGVLLPAGFARLRKVWRTLGASAAAITGMELLQLFTLRGTCDVDDLILNLAGVWMGYGLWYLLHKKLSSSS